MDVLTRYQYTIPAVRKQIQELEDSLIDITDLNEMPREWVVLNLQLKELLNSYMSYVNSEEIKKLQEERKNGKIDIMEFGEKMAVCRKKQETLIDQSFELASEMEELDVPSVQLVDVEPTIEVASEPTISDEDKSQTTFRKIFDKNGDVVGYDKLDVVGDDWVIKKHHTERSFELPNMSYVETKKVDAIVKNGEEIDYTFDYSMTTTSDGKVEEVKYSKNSTLETLNINGYTYYNFRGKMKIFKDGVEYNYDGYGCLLRNKDIDYSNVPEMFPDLEKMYDDCGMQKCSDVEFAFESETELEFDEAEVTAAEENELA